MKDLYLEYINNLQFKNPIKMGERFEQTSHPRSYMDGK